ncbi:MAG TPA: tail fiber protein [Beijerinckiaceae bacterium]|jgi:microcystin-dependent protein
MAQPYVGEIRMFAGNFAPAGWMFCDGQLLPISENETLFQLIGTTYGGDGQSTFALPNLQSRVPIHQGNGFILAETGGAEEITLTTQQIPVHTHLALAASTGQVTSCANAVLALATSQQTGMRIYTQATPAATPLHPSTISAIGGSQPHTNIQPTLALNFIISLFGLFPSPT